MDSLPVVMTSAVKGSNVFYTIFLSRNVFLLPSNSEQEQSDSDSVFSFFIPGLWELNNILLLLGVAERLKIVKSHQEKKNPPTSQRKTEKLYA